MNVYLNFDGNCREAFEFYRAAFGGEFESMQTFGDGPPDMDVPAEASARIMHVALPLGPNGSYLMGSDTRQHGTLTVGNNFSIVYPAQNRAECDAVFARLSEGGEVSMPLQETFWGAYFGNLKDRYGISWMFNIEMPGA